jgi:hypothetical protein
MAMVKTGTFYQVTTIIGKDLDAEATFNGDVAMGLGLIPAGRFMSYDEATKVLTPLPVPITDDAATGALVFGVLAADCDATSATIPNVGMVYRHGTFLKQEIESVNSPDAGPWLVIPPNGPLGEALRGKGINLEYSYPGYEGLEAPPPPYPPIP